MTLKTRFRPQVVAISDTRSTKVAGNLTQTTRYSLIGNQKHMFENYLN